MAQEVSCKIIRTVLDYAESHGGAEAIDQIVAAAHLPLATLRDENAWIDHDTEKRIFRVLDEIVGMKNAAYHCGEYGVRHKSFGALDTFMRALMRPKNVYSRVPYLANRLAKVGTMEIEKLGPSSAQVTYRYHDDYDSIVEICENRRGMLASVPTLWGLPPATVEETECSARGAAVCRNFEYKQAVLGYAESEGSCPSSSGSVC